MSAQRIGKARVTSYTPAEAQQASAKAMSEAELRNAVIDCAKANGWHCYYVHDSRVWIVDKAGNRRMGQMDVRSDKGFPDLSLSRDGETLFRELKREGERPTPEQQAWGDAMGSLWKVWKPTMWLDGTIERELGR